MGESDGKEMACFRAAAASAFFLQGQCHKVCRSDGIRSYKHCQFGQEIHHTLYFQNAAYLAGIKSVVAPGRL